MKRKSISSHSFDNFEIINSIENSMRKELEAMVWKIQYTKKVASTDLDIIRLLFSITGNINNSVSKRGKG